MSFKGMVFWVLAFLVSASAMASYKPNAVITKGCTDCKEASAQISTAGAVSNELGSFINGNCTNASPSVCTFEASYWSATPNCVAINSSTNLNSCFCGVQAASTTSVGVYCRADTGADCNASITKTLSCHGR